MFPGIVLADIELTLMFVEIVIYKHKRAVWEIINRDKNNSELSLRRTAPGTGTCLV
jgi:hypothetical protein